MKAVSKLGWTAYALALAVVALDQAVKYWIVHVVDLASHPTICRNFLRASGKAPIGATSAPGWAFRSAGRSRPCTAGACGRDAVSPA